MQEEKKGLSTVRNWMKQSVSLKLFTISFLALCLLIPSSMVKSIIHERQSLNYDANMDVRSKWALAQKFTGPIITVPVSKVHITDDKKTIIKSQYHFLPEELNITSGVTPKTLRRGIFEVIVYDSDLRVEGAFSIPQDFDEAAFHEVHWDEAFATVGLSDLRGIQNDLKLLWNNDSLPSIPGSKTTMLSSGLTFTLPGLNRSNEAIPFSMNLQLQGSESLSFVPTGKNTSLTMNSDWDSPSFTGFFLPDEREVGKNGFSADWDVLQINRNYPQHWHENTYQYQLENSSFGVDFILPSDAYQKSIRSIKYALMNIALTFLIFFVVEIFTKSRIHPFQYIMVGLSIILFYVLLVSLSEHMSFARSYLIAGTAVVSMIYLYSLSVFKSLKFSIYLLGLSILNYGFIYIILQMTDYALLLGALSMTAILAVVMYGTRNIDWYNIHGAKAKPEKINN